MKHTDIGGQALIEGVMMRSEKGTAVVVRRSDGTLAKEFHHQRTRYKKGSFPTWPFVRGIYAFVQAIRDGMDITTRAAELLGEEETEEPSKFELWLSKRFRKSAMDVMKGVAILLAAILAIGLFVLLPIGIVELIEWIFGEMNLAWSTVLQGLIRLAIFLLSIFGVSRIKDIRRVFMYHGAEHKTIACYEADLEMTPQNAATCTRLHPRCGTNYLFLTMAVSILVTTAVTALCTLIPGFADWETTGMNRFLFRLARIILIPVIAGVSYEVLKAAAKRDNLFCRIVRAPGLALQHLTTQEPTEDMLEVSIASFELALHPPKGDLEFDPATPLQPKTEAAEQSEPEEPKTREEEPEK